MNEIKYGTNYIEAFENLSKRINLPIMEKIVSHMTRTIINGGNLADTLNILANENSRNMQIKYKEYSEKLNSLMILYMFTTVVIPVILFIMIIAATTVIGPIVKAEILLVLYLFFFPIIIVFFIIIDVYKRQHLDRIKIPVFTSVRPLAKEGAVSVYAGKGPTEIHAKVSSIMEAVERYSAEIQGTEDVYKRQI